MSTWLGRIVMVVATVGFLYVGVAVATSMAGCVSGERMALAGQGMVGLAACMVDAGATAVMNLRLPRLP